MPTPTDPKSVYTASENLPVGARIPEFVLRQLIQFGLKQMRDHVDDVRNNPVEELFQMHGEEVIAQVKGYLRDHPNIEVVVNYPRADLHFPFIACINAATEESTNFLGDVGGPQIMGDNGSRQQRVFWDKAMTHVIIAAQDPNLALYLGHIVRFVLASNSFKLAEYYDIHNMQISSQDLQWDERFFPSFCYLRNMGVSYMSVFDFNMSEEAQKLVAIALLVETKDPTGVSIETEVYVEHED